MTQNAIHKAFPAAVWSLVAQPALLHESRRNPPKLGIGRFGISQKPNIRVTGANNLCSLHEFRGTSVLWSYEMPKPKNVKN